MNRGMSRAQRLKEMERLYVLRAYSDIEMAEQLGVARSTVYKDRQLLESEIPFAQEQDGRHRIDRGIYLSSIRVNLHEALALYLAARRASRQTQSARKHASNGLEKLATALQQPMTQRLVQAAESLPSRSTDMGTRNMEQIARGWVEGIVVEIKYRAADAERVKSHRVRPYLIEPSQWSDSVYVIGHSDRADAILPFKTERIERASLTTERFEPPDDFDEEHLLRHAWGIWYNNREPVTVRLRFNSGHITRRVKESVWHPAERLDDTPDGGCIWECDVADWHEMLPWIRSWGADCQVLEPPELRAELLRESREMAALYGWSVDLPFGD